jgi:hypothetical protein
MSYTEAARQALENLRNTEHLSWYVIPLLALVMYVYAVEFEKKNWNIILAGLAFWGMDWINEIINSLILHFTGYAPLWGTPGKSAFIILVGLNIEIMFMFAIAGIVWTKFLATDKAKKYFGINNRWFVAIVGSLFSVFTEILLNKAGMLTWDYPWWSASNPILIVIFGYLTFFIVAFRVYDMPTYQQKIKTLVFIYTVIIISAIIFGSLGWL